MACLKAKGLWLTCVLLWNKSLKPRSSFPSQGLALTPLAGPTGTWESPDHARLRAPELLYSETDPVYFFRTNGICWRKRYIQPLMSEARDHQSYRLQIPSAAATTLFLFLGTSLSLGALSGNGCSTRDAGSNYLLLIRVISQRSYSSQKTSNMAAHHREVISLPSSTQSVSRPHLQVCLTGSLQLCNHSKSPVLWTGMRRGQIDTTICAIYC